MSTFLFLMIRRPPRSTLFLHDALPICRRTAPPDVLRRRGSERFEDVRRLKARPLGSASRCSHLVELSRSEEHTSELQSLTNLVCRLLLEKKKTNKHQLRAEVKRT